MKFKMIHENYNVSDLDRSIKFYNEALDLHEVRRKTTDDFIIVYLSNDVSDFEVKTDMDPERLPSGKFATNALILELGMIAYNILRMIGQGTMEDGLIKE